MGTKPTLSVTSFPPWGGGGTAIYGLYRQDKRHDNVLFGVLYSPMYVSL